MIEDIVNIINDNSFHFVMRWDYLGYRQRDPDGSFYLQSDWNNTLITRINQVNSIVLNNHQDLKLINPVQIIGFYPLISTIIGDSPFFHFSLPNNNIDIYSGEIFEIGILNNHYHIMCSYETCLQNRIIIYHEFENNSKISCILVDNTDFFDYIIPDERIGIFKKPKKFKINDNKRIIS